MNERNHKSKPERAEESAPASMPKSVLAQRLAASGQEEAGPSEAPQVRTGPPPDAGRWARFTYWVRNVLLYHYRNTGLALLVLLVLLGFFIHDAVTRTEPDFTYILCSNYYFDEEQMSEISGGFSLLHGDINGDGTIRYEGLTILFGNQSDPQMHAASIDRLMVSYIEPLNGLYLFEAGLEQEYLWEPELFADLNALGFDTAEDQPWAVDVSGSPLVKGLGLDLKIYALVRNLSESEAKKPELMRNYELSLDFVRYLVEVS